MDNGTGRLIRGQVDDNPVRRLEFQERRRHAAAGATLSSCVDVWLRGKGRGLDAVLCVAGEEGGKPSRGSIMLLPSSRGAGPPPLPSQGPTNNRGQPRHARQRLCEDTREGARKGGRASRGSSKSALIMLLSSSPEAPLIASQAPTNNTCQPSQAKQNVTRVHARCGWAACCCCCKTIQRGGGLLLLLFRCFSSSRATSPIKASQI